MLEPTIPGWKVETLGDDIAWMRFGEDGRLYAVNPEFGLFGVAPGTGWHTNPNAMRTIAKGNSVFTNVALTDDGDIWWEGMTEEPPAHLTDWKGRDWTPDSDEAVVAPQQPVLHADQAVPDPRARVRRPARRADRRDPVRRPSQDHHPARSPRRATGCTAPSWARRFRPRRPPPPPAPSASCAATRWRCCRSSATTPPTTSATGSPSARQHDADKLPRIFYVNWFRRDDDGGFLWPGFGENSRVLKWVVERIEGNAAAVETPIGHVPTVDSRSTSTASTSLASRSRHALAVRPEEWRDEIPQITEWFDKFGDKLPTVLWTELDGLKARLG